MVSLSSVPKQKEATFSVGLEEKSTLEAIQPTYTTFHYDELLSILSDSNCILDYEMINEYRSTK